MTRRRVLALVGLALLAVLPACGDTTEEGSGGAEPPRLAGVVISPPRQVGDVTLPEVHPSGPPTDFKFRAKPGGLLAVYFGYTSCPDVCPTTMSDLKAALARVDGAADRVDVSMATVDPARDTPEILLDYLTHYVDPAHAHALRTEDPEALRRAEDAFDASSSVTTAADGTVEVSHTANLLMVDDTGTIAVMWPFGTPIDDLESDLRILLDDSASNA